MKTQSIIALTLISITSFADVQPKDSNCQPCPDKVVVKHNVKHKKCPLKVVTHDCVAVCPSATVVVVQQPVVTPIPVATNTVTPPVKCSCGLNTCLNHCGMQCPSCQKQKLSWKPIVGLHGAIALGLYSPYATPVLGIRLRAPKLYLGAELYTDFMYGIGLQAIVYVYQGRLLNISVLNPGVWLPFGNSYLSSRNFNRNVDLLLGAGAEFHVHKNVDLTVDYRVNVADPDKAFNTKAVSGARVWKNSFADSQVIIGCVLHF